MKKTPNVDLWSAQRTRVAPAHTHACTHRNTCILTHTHPCAYITLPAPDLQEKQAKAFEGFALKSNLSLCLVLFYLPLTETNFERTPPKSILPANLPLGLPPRSPPCSIQHAGRVMMGDISSRGDEGPLLFEGISVQSGRRNWKDTLESGSQRRHGCCNLADVGVRWWRWQEGRSEGT